MKLSEICERLKIYFDNETLSVISIYKWSITFKNSQEHDKNEPHPQSPKTKTTEETAYKINTLIHNAC